MSQTVAKFPDTVVISDEYGEALYLSGEDQQAAGEMTVNIFRSTKDGRITALSWPTEGEIERRFESQKKHQERISRNVSQARESLSHLEAQEAEANESLAKLTREISSRAASPRSEP